jgi:hypothetical protein
MGSIQLAESSRFGLDGDEALADRRPELLTRRSPTKKQRVDYGS